MEQKKSNKKAIVIALAVLVVIVAAALILYNVFAPKSVVGEKHIAVEVVHGDASNKTFEIDTDEEFLRGALEQINLVQGDESEYGLYILTVDGETVSEANQEWWCITKSGETVMTGVDTTPILDGEHYEITFTVGYDITE